MTDQEARNILLLYRPNSADANDPEFAQALACAQRSPELKAWFENHCAVQEVIGNHFRQIPVPEGFKEQIISERKAQNLRQRVKLGVLLAGVTTIAILGVVLATWLRQEMAIAREQSLAVFQSRMISMVQRNYSMDIETNNLTAIRAYFAGREAVADWVLPPALERQATCTGCGVLPWHQSPVSMVCFSTGRRRDQRPDMFLFVVGSSDVRNAPAAGETKFAPVNSLYTASWTADGRTYVLAIEGDEASLRRYL